MDCIVTLFGVASVPAIFQCTMETLPRWLLMVLVYFDEILVPGKMEQEYLTKLVLKCLNSAGIKLKKEKCAFSLPQVEYVGHISAEGLYPEASKVKAIKEALKPLSLYKLSSSHSLVLSIIMPGFCQTQQPSLPHSTNY